LPFWGKLDGGKDKYFEFDGILILVEI